MKLLIFLFTICTLTGFSQEKTTPEKVFMVIGYNAKGEHAYKTIDSVAAAKIDLQLISSKFRIPQHLPATLTDTRHRNDTVTVWYDTKSAKDLQRNRYNTYAYDSLSRVVNYTYSGCITCSNTPYNYTVMYNGQGQVETIWNRIAEKEYYQFSYDKKGGIRRVDSYSNGRLIKTILLLGKEE